MSSTLFEKDTNAVRDVTSSPSLQHRTSMTTLKPNDTVAIQTESQLEPDVEKNAGGGGDPDPAPDGGLQAWLQVLAGHLMNFNTWGYINSFGLFEAHYRDTLSLPTSTIAWTGGLQIFLLCFVGMFSGRAVDAGYFRYSVVAGSVLQCVGIFMTSLIGEDGGGRYWMVVLAQGVCQGLGNGLVFCPSVSLVATYFVRWRSLAVALTVGGSATGGIVFSLIAQHAFPRIGFAWGVRIMGFVVMFNATVMLSLFRTRLPPRKSGPLFELDAFKEKEYSLFIVGVFLTLWPLYYAYDYINIYATDVVGLSTDTSITILLIVNGVGLPGRVIPALVADRLMGPLNTLIILATLCALLSYMWLAVYTESGLIAFAVVYGLINSGVQGIFMSALTSTTRDLSKVGTRAGMVLSIISFSTLTGAPIAGAIIGADGGSFVGVQVYGGTMMLLGTAVLVLTRQVQTGWKLKARL